VNPLPTATLSAHTEAVRAGWSDSAGTRVHDALVAAARVLSERGLNATVDSVPGPDGVSAFCLDVPIGGPSYAMLQVCDPELANLGVFLTYDRDAGGQPVDSHRLPVFDMRRDRLLTYAVMPVVNGALNPLDPTGRGRSLCVGVFHGRSTVGDLFLQPWTATRLFRGFRPQGQLAAIWADFEAPFAEAISRVSARLVGRRDIHLLPRTGRRSARWIPVPGPPGSRITDLSDAYDAGVALARDYLHRHQAAGRSNVDTG